MKRKRKKRIIEIYKNHFKYIISLIIALPLFILSLPLFLLLSLLIALNLGTPVIFSQDRPGLHGKIFKMYKFRTMTDARDENGDLLPDEERLTPFGRKLRATSLDELPELWNIIKGDMCFVGPRPLRVEYLPLYNKRQAHRHDVRPGITGYAQVHGRNSISWEEKFEKDLYYVKHVSFWLDVKILIDTVATVLKHEGIDSANGGTMPMFTGTPDTKKESKSEKESVNK